MTSSKKNLKNAINATLFDDVIKNPRWRPPSNFKEFGKKFNDKKIQDGVRLRILERD